MDWLNQRPENVVDRAEPGDLLAELRATRTLAPAALKTLDFAFCHWTLYALSRPADTEGIRDLDNLGALAMRALPEGDEATGYRVRWSAFRDLLEAKRLAIGGAQSGRARNLLHAEPILKLLADGRVSQGVLREKLDLSPARLSQVLGVMEEGGLIQRQKRGKENLVSLAGAGFLPNEAPLAHRGVGLILYSLAKVA